MAFNDRKRVPRVPYSGIIKLGVMIKSCSVDLILDRIYREDLTGKIEFVTIKGDPKSEREWEVIRYTKSKDNVMVRIDSTSTENLDWIKSKDRDYNTKEVKLKAKKPFPTAVEWFVVDHLPPVKAVYGHRPTQLEIMCASNDIENIITGLYKNNRGNIVTCVGDGLTARRMDGNGVWNQLPYCNCGYKKGLPTKIVNDSDIEYISDKFCTLKTDDKDEKDVFREIEWTKDGRISLKVLDKSCGPKVELKTFLYKTEGSILQPYTIRTRNLKTYDYITNTLKMIKDGDEASKGLGFLMGIPLILSIRIEPSYVMDNGKKIPKDDIVLTVDFDPAYGNPIQKRLENLKEEGYVKPAQLTSHTKAVEAESIVISSKEIDPKSLSTNKISTIVDDESKEIDPKKILG